MKSVTKATLVLALGALALLILCPIWFALTGAISSQWELAENLGPVFGGKGEHAVWTLLPRAPTLKGLVEVLLDSPGFFVMFWNSVVITAATVLGQMAVSLPAAWVLAKLRLPGKKHLLTLYILLMLMPFQVLMFPQYLVLKRLNLLDTLWAVILPAVFSTFPVFLLHRFFLAIPEEILEAARLDGAGELRIFFQFGLRLGAPGILSVGLLTFFDAWNMIEQPLTFLKTKSLWPLSLFLPEIKVKDMGMGFAASALMLIPALLLFRNGQEYLEQGIALSGGKE